MRPTPEHDNVFDFNAILHPGTVFQSSPRCSRRSEANPSRKTSYSRLLGFRCVRNCILPCLACARRVKAPIHIAEILEALCALDGSGPRIPPGGKPMRLRSVERRAAA